MFFASFALGEHPKLTRTVQLTSWTESEDRVVFVFLLHWK